jgi:hypothetical protein
VAEDDNREESGRSTGDRLSQRWCSLLGLAGEVDFQMASIHGVKPSEDMIRPTGDGVQITARQWSVSIWLIAEMNSMANRGFVQRNPP